MHLTLLLLLFAGQLSFSVCSAYTCDCTCISWREKICWYYNATAHCSNYCCKNHSLRFIPSVPKSVRSLDFKCNNLRSIDRETFFKNVANITALDLSNNKLVRINPRAFLLLTALTTLSISGNDLLRYEDLRTVFGISTLEKLHMDHCKLGRFPGDVFADLSNSMPNLQLMDLAGNRLERVNLSRFSVLTSLREIDLHSNRLISVSVDLVLSIETIRLNINSLYDFLTTCSDDNMSLFPELRNLDLSNNNIEFMPEYICLPKLKVLRLSQNSLSTITGIFNGNNFPCLTELYLTGLKDQAYLVTEHIFQNLTALTKLSFTDMFMFRKILCSAFSACPRLSWLEVSHNQFAFPVCSTFPKAKACENITVLDLTFSHIQRIPEHGFLVCFTKLTHLDLSYNEITRIPDGAFDSLIKLESLKMSFNQIQVVSPSTFSGITLQRLTVLWLEGNPFHCSCEILWFQTLLQESRLKTFSGAYKCLNIPNMSVTKFEIARQSCMLSESASVMIINTVTIVVVVLTIVSAVFRCRWNLRLLLYEAFRGRGETRRQLLINGNFDYDVFVSYDSEDSLWARECLMPELEDRLGLRLCLHERDFIPGRDIVDNIATMVQRSKKVLMVFSNAFVASQWCQFELSFCLQHAMDTEDALIIVCVDDVASRDLTAAMMAVLKTTTYIQWVDGDAEATRAFWGRLHAALHEVYGEEAV